MLPLTAKNSIAAVTFLLDLTKLPASRISNTPIFGGKYCGTTVLASFESEFRFRIAFFL